MSQPPWMNQPHLGQPQAPQNPPPQGGQPGGPGGAIRFHLKPPMGLLAKEMTSPIVTIDGHPVHVAWGDSRVPAPAGDRQVQIACRYLYTYGRAEWTAHVSPQQDADVHYTTPAAVFVKGAIGDTPQKMPGVGALVVTLVVLVLFILLITIVPALLASS